MALLKNKKLSPRGRDFRRSLRQAASPAKKKILQSFFKTGPGEYAEGDLFLGVTVPETRRLIRRFPDLTDGDLLYFLRSPFHEERLAALMRQVDRFRQAGLQEREKIFNQYLLGARHVNNWDLVDLSAPGIAGEYLVQVPGRRKILDRLARSSNLWERRIAVVACLTLIRRNEFKDLYRVTRILMRDPEDLIHKACGWMLREAGKRNQASEEAFLRRYYKAMPRTMLRYAIERFRPALRKAYLEGRIR